MDLAELRLMATLTHALPGALLRLTLDNGRVLTVAHHPSANLTPCAFRDSVTAVMGPCGASRPEAEQLAAICATELAGDGVCSLGAGIFKVALAGTVVLVFATTFGADQIQATLTARGQSGLGVTALADERTQATLVYVEALPSDEALALDLLVDALGGLLVAGLEAGALR